MPNFIQVRAFNHGHSGTYTPGRFWPNGATRKLEIVEDDVAIAQLDKLKPLRKGQEDHGGRNLDIASGPFLPNTLTPDPDRITRAGVAHVRNNTQLSTIGDAEASGQMASAALDAARLTASRANERAADAEITAAEAMQRVTQLEGDLKEASASYAALGTTVAEVENENEQLRAQVADLKAKLAAVDGSGQAAGAQQPQAETQPDGGKADPKAKTNNGKDKGAK
jgi:hypothetical protein